MPVSRRNDELDYLAIELNRLGRQLRAQRERLQVTEALAAWREAARALAHDLKNPLTAMRMALGRLTRPGRTEAALAESVALLQEELDRADPDERKLRRVRPPARAGAAAAGRHRPGRGGGPRCTSPSARAAAWR